MPVLENAVQDRALESFDWLKLFGPVYLEGVIDLGIKSFRLIGRLNKAS